MKGEGFQNKKHMEAMTDLRMTIGVDNDYHISGEGRHGPVVMKDQFPMPNGTGTGTGVGTGVGVVGASELTGQDILAL